MIMLVVKIVSFSTPHFETDFEMSSGVAPKSMARGRIEEVLL